MQVIKIAAVFAGAVLGAGFASGQELMIFFARFKVRGIYGAVISGLFIMLFGGIVCAQSYDLKEKDYFTYLKSVFSASLAKVVYIITQIFLGISFVIMISGSAELIKTQLNTPRAVGEFFTLFICGWCFANRVTGLARLNLYLTPIMLTGILLSTLAAILKSEGAWLSFSNVRENYLVNACLYMSYNILTSAAVLVPTSALAKSKKEAASGGVLGGGALLLVMVLCTAALVKADALISNSAFPMLAVAVYAQKIFSFIYPPLIYMAMLTTAVSSGFCVCEILQKTGMSSKSASILLCILAIPLSLIEFSSLIKNCYALFGFLGFLLIVGIIVKYIKNIENRSI